MDRPSTCWPVSRLGCGSIHILQHVGPYHLGVLVQFTSIQAAISTVEAQCTDGLLAAEGRVKELGSLLATRMQDVRHKVFASPRSQPMQQIPTVLHQNCPNHLGV